LNAHKTPFAGRPTPLVLALSIAYAGTFLAMPMNAQAQSAGPAASAIGYSIEKAQLEQTLLSIGRQSGRTIVFDPALVRSLTASPVKGTLSPEDAVRAALQGTGLVLVVQTDGTLSVRAPVADTKAPPAPVATLKAITVVAERDQAETSFKVDRSSTSTRSDSDLMDVPASISVITAKVLESQQATSVEDAISQVAGVIYTKSPQGTPTFSIRGFGQTSALSNGLMSSAASNSSIFGVERIEVLKGPQAILSGAGSLGGAVNIVTKKPQAETLRELTLQYGSYGDKVIAGDLSGALTEDKKLTYRLIASGEEQTKNWANYKGNHAEYFMPELRWKDDTTDVIVGYSTDNRRIAPSAYTFAYRGSVQETPEQVLGNESDGFGIQAKNYFYTLNQKISPNVSFTSKMQRTENKLSLRMKSPLGLAGADTIYYSSTHSETDTTTNAGDHYFEFKLKSGPVSHKLTTGVSHEDTDTSQLEFDGGSGVLVKPYGSAYSFPITYGTPYSVFTQSGKQMGGYVLDLMSWRDFNLLLGVRRTKYKTESAVQYLSTGKLSATPAAGIWETTPMIGIVYNVTPSISAYANYVDGFNPQLGYTMCDGVPTSPMRTKNKEGGMKFDFLDSKLSVTASVFSLDQSNVMQYNSAKKCYTLLSAQKTKGFEVDVAGEVYKGLNMLFNATYSKAKDVSGSTIEYAARPTQRASLWTTYDFQSQKLHGWGAGFGITGNNKSYLGTKYKTSTSDPAKLSGSARMDANVSYRQKGWSVALGVKNLFNRELYDFATTDSYVPIQQPRTATLTYKVNF
jgi:iron complex outermembrane recepter protein